MFAKRFFFLLLSFFTILGTASFGNDIDGLLGEYQKEVEGPSRTKKESLGHIISYSGEDLRRMQAYKLGDVLKTLPLLCFVKNSFGTYAPTFAGNPHGVSTSMRLYINNHEVSSIDSLSPWMMYEQYPLDHISHIEVYRGESSLSLVGDPSNVTIRLYTKNPAHLNNGTLRVNVDSKNSFDTAVAYGLEDGETTLLAMADGSNTNNSTTYYNGSDIKNDNRRTFAYASIGVKDLFFDIGYTKLSKERFTGLSKDIAPDEGNTKAEDLFVSVTKFFDNHSGNINLAVDKNIRELHESNSAGIMILPVIDLFNQAATVPKAYNEHLTLTKYTFSASKELTLNSHNLFFSSSLSSKEYKVDQRDLISLSNTPITTPFSTLKNESIFSAIVEDNYYFNDDNMLILDLKYDKYYKDGGFNDFDKITTRIGLVNTVNKNFGIKAFISNSFIPPSLFEIDYADKNNKDLKPSPKRIYSIEGVYENENNRVEIYANRYEISDNVALGDLPNQLGFVNSNTKRNGDSISLSYKRKFTKDDELSITLYKTRNSAQTYVTPKDGAIIRASQKYNQFDFYEELIYKDTYAYNRTMKMDASYNLCLGVQYLLRKNLLIAFKGENLLNDDINVIYTDYSDLNNITTKAIQNTDPRGTVSMKWVF